MPPPETRLTSCQAVAYLRVGRHLASLVPTESPLGREE